MDSDRQLPSLVYGDEFQNGDLMQGQFEIPASFESGLQIVGRSPLRAMAMSLKVET